jgi:hypothetical protein
MVPEFPAMSGLLSTSTEVPWQPRAAATARSTGVAIRIDD